MTIRLTLIILLLGAFTGARAQIPVEIFTGHERATFDQMFFRFFKQKDGKNSPFLFFSRQRAAIDYRQTTRAYLPQFGFTEAVSWNPKALKGFAPVLVGQALNRGVFAKTGIQYARVHPDFTFFGWTVVELNDDPYIDLFLLGRYTPRLTGKLHLFLQAEFINNFPTAESNLISLTQRFRLGLKIRDWQFGLGADLAQNGRGDTFARTQNAGLFLRHEF